MFDKLSGCLVCHWQTNGHLCVSMTLLTLLLIAWTDMTRHPEQSSNKCFACCLSSIVAYICNIYVPHLFLIFVHIHNSYIIMIIIRWEDWCTRTWKVVWTKFIKLHICCQHCWIRLYSSFLMPNIVATCQVWRTMVRRSMRGSHRPGTFYRGR